MASLKANWLDAALIFSTLMGLWGDGAVVFFCKFMLLFFAKYGYLSLRYEILVLEKVYGFHVSLPVGTPFGF